MCTRKRRAFRSQRVREILIRRFPIDSAADVASVPEHENSSRSGG
jgi:hypothetical protein